MVRQVFCQVLRQVEARGFCAVVQEAGYLARDRGAVLRLVSEEVFALGVCARWRRQVCAAGLECAARVPLTNADASRSQQDLRLGFASWITGSDVSRGVLTRTCTELCAEFHDKRGAKLLDEEASRGVDARVSTKTCTKFHDKWCAKLLGLDVSCDVHQDFHSRLAQGVMSLTS